MSLAFFLCLGKVGNVLCEEFKLGDFGHKKGYSLFDTLYSHQLEGKEKKRRKQKGAIYLSI